MPAFFVSLCLCVFVFPDVRYTNTPVGVVIGF